MIAPRFVASSTQVENENTSTMMITSLIWRQLCHPLHSPFTTNIKVCLVKVEKMPPKMSYPLLPIHEQGQALLQQPFTFPITKRRHQTCILGHQ